MYIYGSFNISITESTSKEETDIVFLHTVFSKTIEVYITQGTLIPSLKQEPTSFCL